MDVQEKLVAELLRLFPQRQVPGRAAPHECPECDALCAGLQEKSWNDVPRSFIAGNIDVLPLLSKDAYAAFLPAWLREGLLEPDGGVACTLLISLSSAPPVHLFTSEQACLIVSTVEEMIESSTWGSGDAVSAEQLASIRHPWSPVED